MSASKVPQIISDRTYERELKLKNASLDAATVFGQHVSSLNTSPQPAPEDTEKNLASERKRQALIAEVHRELMEEADWDPINPDDLPPPQAHKVEKDELEMNEHGTGQTSHYHGEISSSTSDYSEQASMMSAYFPHPGPDSQGFFSPRFEIERPAKCHIVGPREPQPNPYVPASYYEELNSYVPVTSDVWAFNPSASTFRLQRPQYTSNNMFQQWMAEGQNTTQFLQMMPASYMRSDLFDGPLSGRSDNTVVPDVMITDRVGVLPQTYSPQRRRRPRSQR